ncbi:pyridoxal-phosphate dependent enzyme [Streptomyces sp. NPDC001276]
MTSHAVRSAATTLHGVAAHTPLLSSSAVDDLLGRRVVIKAENVQRTGSFKMRGACNAVASLPPDVGAAGVIGASSGNHAQALTLAAHLFEVPATVVIPADAPASLRAVHQLPDQLVVQGLRHPGGLHFLDGLSRDGHVCHQVSLPVRRSTVDRTDPAAFCAPSSTVCSASSAWAVRLSGAVSRCAPGGRCRRSA